VFCALALPVSAARAWVWPVDGPVLRPFSFDRAHPYAAGQHRGIDIGAPTGTEVVAPARGVVSFAGTVPTGGKTVSIQTPLGYTATLVHLGSIEVRQGVPVAEGDVVGTVGPSGTVDLAEPYVYFGVRLTADEQGYVDPLGLLPPQAAPTPPSVPQAPAVPVAAAVPAAPAVAAPTSAPVASAPAQPSAAAEPAAPASPVAETRAPVATQPAESSLELMPRTTHTSDDATVLRDVRHAPSLASVPVHGAVHARARSSPVLRTATGDAASPALFVDEWGRDHRSATAVRASAQAHRFGWVDALVLGCVTLACAGAALRKRARIMSSVDPESPVVAANAIAQDPRGPRLAVCVGEAPPGPRRRVRGPRGHLRALPPLEGRRRPDGERHGRARHAGDGHGGSRGRLAA
jgi:hypothetical protein